MTDRRCLRFNGRVAHDSLKGMVAADRFTAGDLHRVIQSIAVIHAAPEPGPRARELVLGEGFVVLDRQGRMAFGFAERDGYVGWVDGSMLAAGGPDPTHRVAMRHSIAKATPELKTRDEALLLPHSARVTVTGTQDEWCRIEIGSNDQLIRAWMPAAHLAPLAETGTDPVTVAGLYLGTPYLWGGNSSFGIDCSGLIQASLLACGQPCPGDSDQQAVALGDAIAPDAPVRRGDLFFWNGHVAMAADAETLIHANAHHMAVALEPVTQAIERIAAQGGGPVICRQRI